MEESIIKPEVQKSSSNKGCWISALIVFLVLAILMACGMTAIILIANSSNDTQYNADEVVIVSKGENKAAVINIGGVIYGDSELSGTSSAGLVTPATITADIDTALNDPAVKVIILNIESPGGEAVASDIIYKKVVEAAEIKPVIAYSSSVAASGGYYIAVGADEIMMHPGAITGSIGVIMQTSSLEGLYEKLGIETATFKSAKFKDNEELFNEESDGELDAIYQALVDEIYQDFVNAIVEGRDMSEAEVKALGDGRVYSGRQALENGLIDSTGYYEDLYARAEELSGFSDLTIVEYNHYDFFSSFFGLESTVNNFVQQSESQSVGVKIYYLMNM